jgi:pyruvate/2-oxoacid:ferredoxin oxidoreductase alpha subunit/NAD-dependent dihydropyrimidine dehydrogenase PreA subunit
MTKAAERPKPVLLPALCKGCGRCIEACPKHCITAGHEINQASGLVPILIDWDVCNGCGVCITACPEPYGLTPAEYELEDPVKLFGDRVRPVPRPEPIRDRSVPLAPQEPLVAKGNYAAAIGALLAGCRHVFGYPITPSTEGAEFMAAAQPKLDGVFLQAVSEVATINHMYGCAAAGLPCMTFTSSPGFSLMLEGISYMVGAELPAVVMNVMRGGPGLGNIAPEQADIKLACRGLGHGNTHAIVLAPTTPQEMLDLTMLAFRLAFEYRNPTIVLADGYLGQMTGRVRLPDAMVEPGIPAWAVWGDASHRANLISSIRLDEADLEEHNRLLEAKYAAMARAEQRANVFCGEDAEVVIVACNTPARMGKGAVESLRRDGIRAALFHPVTLWPFPIDALRPLLRRARDVVVVEASSGQLEDELRLSLSHANEEGVRIHHVRHMGGVLPQEAEIAAKVRAVRALEEVSR